MSGSAASTLQYIQTNCCCPCPATLEFETVSGWPACRCLKVTDAGYEHTARHCRKLRELRLYACNLITDRTLLAIGAKLHSLRILDICGANSVSGRHVYLCGLNWTWSQMQMPGLKLQHIKMLEGLCSRP